jgi:2,5-dihydroxypyridine 5,6-dioxygenase
LRKLPLSPLATADLVALFTRYLELCRVKAGETVVITTDPLFNPHYPAAFFAAAQQLGATPYVLTLTSNMPILEGDAITEFWKRSDMVIGCMSPSINWLYSEVHNQALKAGVRTLMVFEPEDLLRRQFPDPAVIARTKAGAKFLQGAKIIKVKSGNGTDLVMSKEGRNSIYQVGVSDTPGRWDHWPAGLVACAPLEGTCEGTLVLDEGDICFRFGRYFQSKVYMVMEKGRIVSIDGGADAILLRDYFESAGDDRAYMGPAHIGWGTDHRAKYHELALYFREYGGHMSSESFYGNIQIAFGRNMFGGLGGTNHVKFHVDLPLKSHSLWVDDVQVIDRGTIVPAALR